MRKNKQYQPFDFERDFKPPSQTTVYRNLKFVNRYLFYGLGISAIYGTVVFTLLTVAKKYG